MELFHGTTHNFDKFSLKAGNPMNHAGIGVYLTSCIDDASRHYVGRGPDLINRIGQLTSEIYNEYEYEYEDGQYISWKTCEQLARDILDGKQRLLLRCEIKPEAKLLQLSMNNFLELYDIDDEEYADYSEAGLAIALLCEAFDMDYPDACEMTTDEIFKWIRNSYRGDDVWCGEIFRMFVELLGFDGVEYEDASNYFPCMVSKGTKHFVLYNPEMAVIKYKQELDVA